MPTPDSGLTTSGNGNKRRRTGEYSLGHVDVHQDAPERGLQVGSDDEDEVEVPGVTMAQPEEDEHGFQRYYDPNQNPEKRRELRASLRDHQRMVEGEWGLSMTRYLQR